MDAWGCYVLSARRSARRVPATMSASSGGSSPGSSELPLGATAYEGRGRGRPAILYTSSSSLCNTKWRDSTSHPRRSSDGSTGARASASRSNVCWMMALSDPSLINVSAEAHNDPIQTLKP